MKPFWSSWMINSNSRNILYKYWKVWLPLCTNTLQLTWRYQLKLSRNIDLLYKYWKVRLLLCTNTLKLTHRYQLKLSRNIDLLYKYQKVWLPLCTNTLLLTHRYQLKLSRNIDLLYKYWKVRLQGLFVPFARKGSGDPVRVLHLFHNKYTGYNWSIYCWDYVQLVATESNVVLY